MQNLNIFLEVGRVLLENPTFEIVEVERVPVFYFVGLEPLQEIRKVPADGGPAEDALDHMAAEDSHLDLVLQVRVDGLAVLDHSEQVHSDGPIPELELVEILLGNLEPVPVLETLDGHVLHDVLNKHVSVLVLEQVLEMLVL